MYDPTIRATLASALAGAFLGGAWNEERLVARAAGALEPRPRWLRPVVREVLAAYHRPPLDRPRELAHYVAIVLEELRSAEPPVVPRVRRWTLFASEMRERRFPVPVLHDVGALAALLGEDPRHLAWLADARGLEREVAHERLRNYRYTWLARAGGPPRVLERPKARLKAAQRRVLHEVLDHVPAHDTAHGFVPGRSVRSHAAAHVGRRVVLRLDLEDFFASVRAGRVFGMLRTAGYPEAVTHALTALMTNVVPAAEWARVPPPREPWLLDAHARLGRRLATPHLPQGAPTSPALANLAAFGLDRRVAGLAAAVGATYTRYADDLVLSGGTGLLRREAGVRETVARIAREEGFRVNERKTRLMTSAGRQRVGGVVVNARPNVARREYDLLKAVLHNAGRDGPGDLDPAVLRGRIAWVASLHPGRGAELERRFAQVAWSS
jgi:hypothetical protein